MRNAMKLIAWAAVLPLPLSASPAFGDYVFSGPGSFSLGGGPTISGQLRLTGLAATPASIGTVTSNTIFGRGSIDAFILSGPAIEARSLSGGEVTQLITGPASPLGGPGNSLSMGGITMSLPGSVNVLSGPSSAGGNCTDCSSQLALQAGGTVAFTFASSLVFTNTIPEPSAVVLLATGLGVLGWRIRGRSARG